MTTSISSESLSNFKKDIWKKKVEKHFYMYFFYSLNDRQANRKITV